MCLLFIGVFLQELLCPSQPVSEPVLSPVCPQACPCHPRTGCSASSKLPAPFGPWSSRVPKLCKDILSLSSLSATSWPTTFSSPTLCKVCLFSSSVLVSRFSQQPPQWAPLSHTSTSNKLPVPPISFTGFWVQHFLPPASSVWSFPQVWGLSSPSSSSLWPSQMSVVSAGTLSSSIFFLPTTLVWLPPPWTWFPPG